MPTSDERLTAVLAKIERANNHIRDLESRIEDFRKTVPYGVHCEKDSQTGESVYRLRICQPIPVAIPLIAGDAAHN